MKYDNVYKMLLLQMLTAYGIIGQLTGAASFMCGAQCCVRAIDARVGVAADV